jgi:hypothetical protein
MPNRFADLRWHTPGDPSRPFRGALRAIVYGWGDTDLMDFGGFATPERDTIFHIDDLRRDSPDACRVTTQTGVL